VLAKPPLGLLSQARCAPTDRERERERERAPPNGVTRWLRSSYRQPSLPFPPFPPARCAFISPYWKKSYLSARMELSDPVGIRLQFPRVGKRARARADRGVARSGRTLFYTIWPFNYRRVQSRVPEHRGVFRDKRINVIEQSTWGLWPPFSDFGL